MWLLLILMEGRKLTVFIKILIFFCGVTSIFADMLREIVHDLNNKLEEKKDVEKKLKEKEQEISKLKYKTLQLSKSVDDLAGTNEELSKKISEFDESNLLQNSVKVKYIQHIFIPLNNCANNVFGEPPNLV